MRNKYLVYGFIIVLALCNGIESSAQINLSQTAAWQRNSNFATGIGWMDTNNDGYLDLIITNGLDVTNTRSYSYPNNAGTLSTTANWYSSNTAPFCCLYIGDFDNDGDSDMAVASLGITSIGLPPVPHFVYYNEGGLSSSPGWTSPQGNAFSCVGGDIDGDGDIDLVIGQGDYATRQLQKSKMYLNENGTFSSTPAWETDARYYTAECILGDIDNDGDLDLALGNERSSGAGSILIFMNNNGTFETIPSWSTDAIVGGRQMAFGDVDGDSYLDLAVAGSAEKFFLFKNNNGIFETNPSWQSTIGNEPSCVSWVDVDGDGDLDLSAGAWQSPLGIFENVNGTLSGSFVWSNIIGNGIQQIAWADYDGDDLIEATYEFDSDGSKKLFYIGKKNIHSINQVSVNGSQLNLAEYCYDLIEGWISLAVVPGGGEPVVINYTYSNDLDMAVTNWGNAFVFENNRVVSSTVSQKGIPQDFSLFQNYPNPFNPSTKITFCIPSNSKVELTVYDITGREIMKLIDAEMQAGQHYTNWNGMNNSGEKVNSGIYFYSLKSGPSVITKKMTLIK